MEKIREEEQRTLWTYEYEDQLAVRENCTMHSGMMFTLAKGLMERTKLWRIVRRMPKGSILHAHLDAIVDLDFVFDTLLSEPGMHMSAPDARLGTSEARADAVVNFRFFAKDRNTSMSIWDDKGYQPGEFVPLSKAADSFPDGGREGWIRWMKSKTTISETDAVEQHHGVDHIWRKFSKCFVIMGTVIHYEPIFRKFLRRMMKQYYDDGVYWGEIRWVDPPKAVLAVMIRVHDHCACCLQLETGSPGRSTTTASARKSPNQTIATCSRSSMRRSRRSRPPPRAKGSGACA